MQAQADSFFVFARYSLRRVPVIYLLPLSREQFFSFLLREREKRCESDRTHSMKQGYATSRQTHLSDLSFAPNFHTLRGKNTPAGAWYPFPHAPPPPSPGEHRQTGQHSGDSKTRSSRATMETPSPKRVTTEPTNGRQGFSQGTPVTRVRNIPMAVKRKREFSQGSPVTPAQNVPRSVRRRKAQNVIQRPPVTSGTSGQFPTSQKRTGRHITTTCRRSLCRNF